MRRNPKIVDVPPDPMCDGCGACCDTCPGWASVEQLGAPDGRELMRRVSDALKTFTWVLQKRQGAWILRPASWLEIKVAVHFGKPNFKPTCGPGMGCVFLLPEGCCLKRSRRPGTCRALIPGTICRLHPTWDPEILIEEWKTYRNYVIGAVNLAEATYDRQAWQAHCRKSSIARKKLIGITGSSV